MREPTADIIPFPRGAGVSTPIALIRELVDRVDPLDEESYRVAMWVQAELLMIKRELAHALFDISSKLFDYTGRGREKKIEEQLEAFERMEEKE